jgi:flagellar basal body-associated protein FliL
MSTATVSPEKRDAEAGARASAPARGKSSMLTYGVGALVFLLVLGAATWFLLLRLTGGAAAAHQEPAPEKPVKATVLLGSVVVNLGPPEARHHLKVGVELGVAAIKEAKKVEDRRAQVLDLIITVLSTTPIEPLASNAGRVELEKRLVERIHEELKLEHVSRVYFTEFLIR